MKRYSNWLKEIQLSYQYTNHCIRATAVSLLDECNFEARHIMRVSGHRSESSIRSYSRRLSEVKQKEISHSLSTAMFWKFREARANSEADCPLVGNTVPRSPITMQNFASQSQETVNFNAGAFSGAAVAINFYQGNSKWFSLSLSQYWAFKSRNYLLIYFVLRNSFTDLN